MSNLSASVSSIEAAARKRQAEEHLAREQKRLQDRATALHHAKRERSVERRIAFVVGVFTGFACTMILLVAYGSGS